MSIVKLKLENKLFLIRTLKHGKKHYAAYNLTDRIVDDELLRLDSDCVLAVNYTEYKKLKDAYIKLKAKDLK